MPKDSRLFINVHLRLKDYLNMGSSIPPSMALISGPNSPGKSRQAQSFSADNILATYPLTHSQEGIWVDYLADKTSTQYNLTLEWSFGNIDDELFKTHKIVAGMLSFN